MVRASLLSRQPEFALLTEFLAMKEAKKAAVLKEKTRKARQLFNFPESEEVIQGSLEMKIMFWRLL